MRRIQSGLLMVAAAAAVLLAACGGKGEGDGLAKAKSKLTERDLNGAIIELKSALQQSPNLAEARFLLGATLLERGELNNAQVELNKAVELGFDEARMAPKLARALLAAGKFKEVLQGYEGVLLKSPEHQSELRTAIAVAHARLNQSDQAMAAVDEAVKLDPRNSWALLTKARLLGSQAKVDEALALADQAVRGNDPSGDAHMLKGMLLLYGKGKVDEAVAEYRLAAKDQRQDLGARLALIQIFVARKNPAAAKVELAELKKSFAKSPYTLFAEATIAYAEKDYAKTDSIVEQLLRFAPNSPQLLILGGAASAQQGALVSAEARLGKVVQTVERAPLARKLLAETYLRMGRPDKAIAAVKPILEGDKADADALAIAGQAMLQSGDTRQAEAFFAGAAKVKPDDAYVATALALTDLAKGNADRAFGSLQAIAAKDAGETADLALITARLRRREFDAALAAIDALAKKQPNKATVSQLRGTALREKGDLVGARAAFEEGLKLQPTYFSAIAALADLDMRAGKSAAAKERLQAAIKADHKNVQAYMVLLQVLEFDKAKAEERMAVVDTAIKANPSDAAPRLAKISLLTRQGNSKGAAGEAQAALSAIPDHPELLEAAGRALTHAGEYQQAITALNMLASIKQASPIPYLRLADLHARRGDAAAVRSSLSRAFDVSPTSPDVHRRLLQVASRATDVPFVVGLARDLQKRQPELAAGQEFEGDIEVIRKDWGAALAAYRPALAKRGASERLPGKVFDALVMKEGEAAADRFAGEWLKTHPKDVAFVVHLGGISLLRNDAPAAERRFREALALNPLHTKALNNLAWLLAERKDKGAVELAEKAVSLEPGAVAFHDTLAKALAAAGRLPQAIEVQRRAVAMAPDEHGFRLQLAKLYIAAGEKSKARAELDGLAKVGKPFGGQAVVADLLKSLGN